MSLLRDVLKKNQQGPGPSSSRLSSIGTLLGSTSSKRSVKSYAASVKSAGGATIRSLAESMLSFYSMITLGGTRVPKRRRPDFSTLGVPQWYAEDPPPAPLMPGTDVPSPIPAIYTSATAGVLHARNEGEKPWLGIVLYSHAHPNNSQRPIYHQAAQVQGEVRVLFKKPVKVGSIDIWLTVASDSVLDIFKPPMLGMTATLWNREKGHPKTPTGRPLEGKFPKGTFVFPFEFPELPTDTLVKHPSDTKIRNQARVPMPPSYFISKVTGFSGNISYVVGVNIVFDGIGGIDDEFDMPFQYMPLFKPLPQVKTLFPFIPTREDWPFKREVIGGWTLTPFGGRGRLGEEMVEVEGILGVQEPAVYTAGQTIEFSLLLWSTNPLALEALGQSAAIEVGLYKSDIFALDVMNPRTSTRKNRYLTKVAPGRTWRTDDGRPDDDAPEPEFHMVQLPDPPSPGSKPQLSPAAGGSHRVKGAPSSRMKEMWVEDDKTEMAESEKAVVQDGVEEPDNIDSKQKENQDSFAADSETLAGSERAPHRPTDHFVRLDGEVKVPVCSHPSFRYTHMGREYVVHLIISHPQYSHISPNATGLLAEFPIWYVVDRFSHLPPGVANAGAGRPQDFSKLPVTGTTIAVGPDAVRAPVSVGVPTTEKRPTGKYTRYFAF
ncbi:hypothetical protein R3P38DRAFT_3468419 [Favolaschia claudopus]|uniref:Arrestin-like N-terminal domain-containing protein n=1 Tax=Favolaschia claudopus TaxID=2862362 RepID=A0AAW0CJ45_9AGAR